MVSFQIMVDAEHPSYYHDQGFHPVHLGDTFANGRYTVRHKLGYGKSSTTWLVYDSVTCKNVALKIVAASQSPGVQLDILKHLQSTFDANEEGNQHVLHMLDHFEHDGPNGRHLCIVSEALGLSLAVDIEDLWSDELFPPEIVKRLVGQISLGLRYLHRRNIAHGDLHQGNILLYCPQIASWSEEDIEKYLHTPHFGKVFHRCKPGTDSSDLSAPNYLVAKSETSSFLSLCFENPCIKICDFSESYLPNLPHPRSLATPHMYRPPEGLFGLLPHATAEADIWALAGLFHALFKGGCGIFYSGTDDRILREMVLLLGKLPEPCWSLWNKRKEVFDEEGKVLPTYKKEGRASGTFLKLYDETMGDEEERSKFEGLLRSMVRYEPEKRTTVEDVIASDWFVNYCQRYAT